MSWPIAFCVFSMFALAGWAMWLLTRADVNRQLVTEIVAELRELAWQDIDDLEARHRVLTYASVLEREEIERGL